MANKKKTAKAQADARANDIITYKILGAFLAACVCVFILMTISSQYQIGNQFLAVHEGLMTVGIIAALVALLGFLFLIIDRFASNRTIKIIGAILLPVGLLVWISCLLMYYFYIHAITILCFLYPAAAVLYLVYLIYQSEFFALSIDCVVCAFAFYILSKLLSAPLSYVGILIIVGIVAINAALLFLTVYSKKCDGKLTFGKKEVKFLAFKVSDKILFSTAALMLVGLALSLILGAMTAYVFLFITLIYLFIMAVYYTIKLM
ncbi:MAG: hypothetical protein E7430_08070 [Ruminococcaceae bacterium]|nr:hypothetical protein [Oscillospiraceae bacterium]